MLALYIGGMGAKQRNFHKELVSRMGFAGEADQIQELYLAGRKQEAALAVPTQTRRRNFAGRSGRACPRTARRVARNAGDVVAGLRRAARRNCARWRTQFSGRIGRAVTSDPVTYDSRICIVCTSGPSTSGNAKSTCSTRSCRVRVDSKRSPKPTSASAP